MQSIPNYIMETINIHDSATVGQINPTARVIGKLNPMGQQDNVMMSMANLGQIIKYLPKSKNTVYDTLRNIIIDAENFYHTEKLTPSDVLAFLNNRVNEQQFWVDINEVNDEINNQMI